MGRRLDWSWRGERICVNCGEPFYPTHKKQKLCGDPCRHAFIAARNRSDPEAQRERGKLGGAIRGRQMNPCDCPGIRLKGVMPK